MSVGGLGRGKDKTATSSSPAKTDEKIVPIALLMNLLKKDAPKPQAPGITDINKKKLTKTVEANKVAAKVDKYEAITQESQILNKQFFGLDPLKEFAKILSLAKEELAYQTNIELKKILEDRDCINVTKEPQLGQSKLLYQHGRMRHIFKNLIKNKTKATHEDLVVGEYCQAIIALDVVRGQKKFTEADYQLAGDYFLPYIVAAKKVTFQKDIQKARDEFIKALKKRDRDSSPSKRFLG